MAEEEPKDDAGLELSCEEKGLFALGVADLISSPNGSFRLSGVSDRNCDTASL